MIKMLLNLRFPHFGKASASSDLDASEIKLPASLQDELRSRALKILRPARKWEIGIRLGAGISSLILAVNLFFLIWVERNALYKFDGILTIDQGSHCADIDRIITLLHLVSAAPVDRGISYGSRIARVLSMFKFPSSLTRKLAGGL